MMHGLAAASCSAATSRSRPRLVLGPVCHVPPCHPCMRSVAAQYEAKLRHCSALPSFVVRLAATPVWRRRSSHRHKGYEAVVSFSSREVEVGGVNLVHGLVREQDLLAGAGIEQRSSLGLGEMRRHIEVGADPVEVDDILT